MTRPAPGTLIIVGLLLASPALASPGADSAVAQLEYDQGGSFEGDGAGDLQLDRIMFPAGPPVRLVIENATARLVVVETTYNRTEIAGKVGVEDPSTGAQTLTGIDVSDQRLLLDWPANDADDLLVVRGPGYLQEGERPFSARILAQAAEWSPPVIGGTGTPFLWPAPGGTPGHVAGDVGVWHRAVRLTTNDSAVLEGGLVLHLRQARLASGDQVHGMSDYVTTTESASLMGSTRRSEIKITEAFLFVQSGDMRVPMRGAVLAAESMNWTLDGEAVLNGASGSFRVGQQEGFFSHQVLGLAGKFSLRDSVVSRGTGQEGRHAWGEASARGDFSVIAIDYVVHAAGPTGPSFLEQALWITLALGLLSLAIWAMQHLWVFLYTRIHEDAVLDHPKRAEIMSFVEANPGCHVLRVAEDLGLARGVARHHLMVLERAGRLHRYHDYGQTLLVPAHQSKHDALRALAEEDPTLASIRALVATGVVRRAQLVAMLRNRHGVADPTARRWIHKAVRAGLIDEARSGQDVVYHTAA